MKRKFTCSVAQNSETIRWTHVSAEDARAAVQAAIEQAKAKGRCMVEVYPGNTVPFDPTETPAATASVIA